MNDLLSWGLPGLFLVAMMAGSILPVPSEALLAALVYQGVSPGLAVGVATVGNVMGALTVYALGRWGASRDGAVGRWLERRHARAGPRFIRARERMATLGAPMLLLAWLPVVGDVFVLAAGAVGVRLGPFLVFVFMGKGLRYLAVALSVLAARNTGISHWG